MCVCVYIYIYIMYNNVDVIQIVSLLYMQFDVSSFIFHVTQLTSSYMYCMLTCTVRFHSKRVITVGRAVAVCLFLSN